MYISYEKLFEIQKAVQKLLRHETAHSNGAVALTRTIIEKKEELVAAPNEFNLV